MKSAALGLAVVLLTSGAAARDRNASDWRQVTTAADRDRLKQWRDAWTAALAEAGNRPEIAAAPEVFNPDRTLERPLPPPGTYRCHVFKLGRKTLTGPPFVAQPASACRIEGIAGDLRFVKLNGSQRPAGRIYANDNARAVFLGTLVLGDETRKIPYGRDTARNMAGFVERIGDTRWRIVLPFPAFESKLDVIELTPAG